VQIYCVFGAIHHACPCHVYCSGQQVTIIILSYCCRHMTIHDKAHSNYRSILIRETQKSSFKSKNICNRDLDLFNKTTQNGVSGTLNATFVIWVWGYGPVVQFLVSTIQARRHRWRKWVGLPMTADAWWWSLTVSTSLERGSTLTPMSSDGLGQNFVDSVIEEWRHLDELIYNSCVWRPLATDELLAICHEVYQQEGNY